MTSRLRLSFYAVFHSPIDHVAFMANIMMDC